MYETSLSLLKGAIDMHVHCIPDVKERRVDEIELARQGLDAGMRGFVIKCHDSVTADRAYLVRKVVEDIEIFGGISLDHSVGGINPTAVEAAIKFVWGKPLTKVVWLPTFDAENNVLKKGSRWKTRKEGVKVVEDGKLVPDLYPILELVAEHNIILGSGHLNINELRILIKAVKEVGVKKFVVNHPLSNTMEITIDEQRELAAQGAYMEHCANHFMPMRQLLSPKTFAQAMREVGPQSCILATDFGQPHHPSPVEGLRMFIHAMLLCGVSEEDIETMVKTNPARLLDLAEN
jgi:hypothetical protein